MGSDKFDKHRLPNFRYENLCCVWIYICLKGIYVYRRKLIWCDSEWFTLRLAI